MAGRIRNRRELRAEYEAAERREQEAEGEREDEEEDEEEEGGEAEAEGEVEEAEGGDEDEEEAPAKKKKKVTVVKEAKPKRVRSAKAVRMKVVWKVFNNSNQAVAAFDYSRKRDAEEHAAKLKAEKNQTFFIQPVKENLE